MLKTLNIQLELEEQELETKKLMKAVMRKWIDASDAILEMVVLHLPSPKEAQVYRAKYLYEGDINDPCGQAM